MAFQKLRKKNGEFVLTQQELSDFFEEIYMTGFRNGMMQEAGLERCEMLDNRNWFFLSQN